MPITVEVFCLFAGYVCVAPSAQDLLGIGPHQLVPARLDGFDPLGFIAQSDARHLLEIRFFLHAAGVGKDQFGAHLQTLHLQIGQRLQNCDAVECIGVMLLLNFFLCARVQQQHDWQVFDDIAQCAQDVVQALGIVSIFLPMKGAERVVLVAEAKGIEADLFFGALAVVQHGIKHHITNIHDALRRVGVIRAHGWERKAFMLQVVHRRLRGAQQQAGDAIGEHTVDLFRHGRVLRAQVGLNMRHRDVQLGRRQRAGERGVGVAVDQHPVGLFLLDEPLDVFEHAPGHGTVVQAGDVQFMMRARDVELLEENVRHIGIEVLARVDDDFLDVVARLDGPTNGCGLDELRAGTKNGKNFQEISLR